MQQCKGRGWKSGRDLAVKLKTVTGTLGGGDTIYFPPSIKEIWQIHARHICREDSNVLLLLCAEHRCLFFLASTFNEYNIPESAGEINPYLYGLTDGKIQEN